MKGRVLGFEPSIAINVKIYITAEFIKTKGYNWAIHDTENRHIIYENSFRSNR